MGTSVVRKISRNRYHNLIVPEDTRQIKYPFMNGRNLDKNPFVINFRIDVRTKSMLSITSS